MNKYHRLQTTSWFSRWYRGFRQLGQIIVICFSFITGFTLLVGIIILPLWFFAKTAPQAYTITILAIIVSFVIFRISKFGAWRKAGMFVVTSFLIVLCIASITFTVLLAIAGFIVWTIVSSVLLLLVTGYMIGVHRKA